MKLETILEEVSDGYMNYNNLMANLENLLDKASESLDEDIYREFKQELKLIIMQEL